ncbi:hypothetical protein SDRG_11165 [Saprolegnia diclina VS20]|uniref:Uncharacterized protein n=1 Tax=Saprolegnia diclina (strain VS20) TaxID=1156394 RepID=T0Q070_SAPDV|nr:hypothetical protein SDRG_11165 [Saprolegnia diclina VS20]EQC31244.1 hypothetical protein SDRG_11165 [Saprolegnia diclina VS20]|eukprot:XP_008615417.1 hypothetical protein SDRG_11165 [Saprolegnia diclina VS20]
MSGLAGEIRAATESEQFDLGGYTEARTRDLVVAAFGAAFEISEMLRFTFVVGGGKLVRSRYPEELPKWMANALRDVGFVEDRSAACTMDCQGMFKQQHDTGQNLKTILVFPKVVATATGGKTAAAAPIAIPSVDETPELLMLSCEVDDFIKTLVPLELPSWRQKKRAVKFIQDAMAEFALLEAKMVRGEILDAAEQAAYDGNAGQEANDAKIAHLQAEIKRMVDEKQLTASEKKELVATVTANVDALTAELENLSIAKQKEKATTKLQALEKRLAHVQSISPITHPLRHAAQVLELHLALIPLQILQEKEHSMSLTLADLKTLQGKKGIEEALYDAETASIEYFDDDFHDKCDRVAKEAHAKYKKAKGGAKKPATSGWATVPKKKPTTFKAAPARGAGSGFARAFGNDSDSD